MGVRAPCGNVHTWFHILVQFLSDSRTPALSLVPESPCLNLNDGSSAFTRPPQVWFIFFVLSYIFSNCLESILHRGTLRLSPFLDGMLTKTVRCYGAVALYRAFWVKRHQPFSLEKWTSHVVFGQIQYCSEDSLIPGSVCITAGAGCWGCWGLFHYTWQRTVRTGEYTQKSYLLQHSKTIYPLISND